MITHFFKPDGVTPVQADVDGISLSAMEDILNRPPISLLDFPGADPSGNRSSIAAFNAAMVELTKTGGGQLALPRGFLTLGATDEVLVTCPVKFVGQGRGVNSGSGYFGGTLVRTANPTGHVFNVQSRGAVSFQDFAIDSAVAKTSGAAICLQGDSVSGNNTNSSVKGMYLGSGLYDGIRVIDAVNWQIDGNVIQDYLHDGISLTGEGGTNPDATTGQSSISNNTIWAFQTGKTARANITYNCGGDVKILGNKLIGGQLGVFVYPNRGPTGTVVIGLNSIEQHFLGEVRVQQGAPGIFFANVVVADNQFSTLEDGSGFFNTNYQSAVALVQADSMVEWLRNVTVSGNVFNMAINVPDAFISAQAGMGVAVTGNVMNANGIQASIGASSGGTATGVIFAGNVFTSMPGGFYNGVSANAVVHDLVNRMTVGQLNALGNGSEVYVVDGVYGSSPLVGGGSGTFARRIAGAWRG